MNLEHSDKNILVAEDQEALKEMLATILEDEDYQVDTASNGNEAWNLVKNKHYDLLLTDLYMPEMNGIELIQKCQQHSPETTIILLSGGGRELKAETGDTTVSFLDQKIKIDLFLKKPCNLIDLLDTVENLLS